MNPNVKLLVQFLVTTEVIVFLGWLLNTLIHSGATLDPNTRGVIETVCNNFVPLVSAGVGFWLGTSLSSAAKDHTINQVINKTTT